MTLKAVLLMKYITELIVKKTVDNRYNGFG
jgi:hypothetical protein